MTNYKYITDGQRIQMRSDVSLAVEEALAAKMEALHFQIEHELKTLASANSELEALGILSVVKGLHERYRGLSETLNLLLWNTRRSPAASTTKEALA